MKRKYLILLLFPITIVSSLYGYNTNISLAIMKIENNGGPEFIENYFGDLLEFEMMNTGIFKIKRINGNNKKYQIPYSKKEETQFIEIGKVLKVNKILTGSIDKNENLLIFKIMMFDIKKGKKDLEILFLVVLLV